MRNPFRRNNVNNSQSQVIFDPDFYSNFWQKFRSHLDENDSPLTVSGNLYNGSGENNKYTYSKIHFGECDPNTHYLAGWTWAEGGQIGTKFFLKNNDALFDWLKAKQDSFRHHFDFKHPDVELDWYRDGQRYNNFGIIKKNVDFQETSNHQELFKWLRVNLEILEIVCLCQLALYFLEPNN